MRCLLLSIYGDSVVGDNAATMRIEIEAEMEHEQPQHGGALAVTFDFGDDGAVGGSVMDVMNAETLRSCSTRTDACIPK